MPRVLILIDHYLPGCKYGGTLRTIANLVESLGSDIEFWVVTSDRDLSDAVPYAGMKSNTWTSTGKARVHYTSQTDLSLTRLGSLLKKLCDDIQPDVVFLNGFFAKSTMKSLVLRRLGMLPHVPVLLAPRGQLSPGSLGMKAAKKQLYLRLARITGLYKDLSWQAASSLETQDIKRFVGGDPDIYLAPNIPLELTPLSGQASLHKIPGEVKLIFLSRVSPVKNLMHTLNALRRVSGQVRLDIFGPIDDLGYWRECQNAIVQLPDNIIVQHVGEISFSDVPTVLSRYHFFVLPTLGENFGHAIFEALSQGCPVIISDQTPWRDLAAKHAGWDLPLEASGLWEDIFRTCVQMNQQDYDHFSRGARACTSDWLASAGVSDKSVAMFANLLEKHAGSSNLVSGIPAESPAVR